jgi:hypothetical protein
VTVPAVTGILTGDDIRQTAGSIAAMQEATGAIPLTPGGSTDLWNHIEAAMGLLIGGEIDAAKRAFRWAVSVQRADGSWPLRTVTGRVGDPSGDANGSAYLATGLWMYWLLRRDQEFLAECWPAVRRGLDFAVRMQLPFGGIAWTQEWARGRPATSSGVALLAGSASIHQSLRAGTELAGLLGEPRPAWESAADRLGTALTDRRDRFLDKARYSMDWYYPVLTGVLRGDPARDRIAESWDRFVCADLGVLCVDSDPWVTGAETCELAIALAAIGEVDAARRLLGDMQHLRTPGGGYWTGVVLPDLARWPIEHSTYTAAAVILAADAISQTTPAAGFLLGASADQFAGLAEHPT